jgi:hypothetical protein
MHAHEQKETELPHNGCEKIGSKSKKMICQVFLIRLYELETYGRGWDLDKAQHSQHPHSPRQNLLTRDEN